MHIGIDLSAALKTNANCCCFIFYSPDIYFPEISSHTFSSQMWWFSILSSFVVPRLPCCADWQVATNLDQQFFSFVSLTKHGGNVFAAECNGMAERNREEKRGKERKSVGNHITWLCMCMPKTKCSFTQKNRNHTTGYFSTGNGVPHLTGVPMDFFHSSYSVPSNLLVSHET